LGFGPGEDHPAALLIEFGELFDTFQPGLHFLHPGFLDADIPFLTSGVRLDSQVLGMFAEFNRASSFLKDGVDDPGTNFGVVAGQDGFRSYEEKGPFGGDLVASFGGAPERCG